jgi:dinuclear metal center YbgI/SA1388 family protein
MAQLRQIVDYCNNLLRIQDFNDYCPNGLQVEGKSTINKIIAGVTASQAFIEQAIQQQADAVLVHHGYFWKNESPAIVGLKKNRIARLLAHEISLLAYHLPLDAHDTYGNNAALGTLLGIQHMTCAEQGALKGLLWSGQLQASMSADQFAQHIEASLGRLPLHLSSSSQQAIKRVAWCTGGAQNYIEQAAELGVDAYISGEVSEQNFHLAKELDLHYFAAGHHATERYGVQALGQHLQNQFDLNYVFVDVPNPV